jgi:hypothetical protein
MIEEYKKNYEKNGYTIAKIYNNEDHKLIIEFTKNWVLEVLKDNSAVGFDKKHLTNLNLENYHQWQKNNNYAHDGVFGAKNRYIDPTQKIKDKILNTNLRELIANLGVAKFDLWRDPGLEWLGFRIIRPNMGDGYPASCKNWGAAAGVVSVWLPIIGFSELETIAMSTGSHLKQYNKYMPQNSKFTDGEYRLSPKEKVDLKRLNLNLGEVIIYHPGMIHTEDVLESSITRINLEFRFIN